MARSLLEILAEFVEKPPANIGISVVHLASATEREPIIAEMIRAFNCQIDIFPAVNGAEEIAAGHPTLCATESGKIRTAGEIGCLLSHVNLARKALMEGRSHLIVFEDDCDLAPNFSLEAVENYLRSVKEITKSFSLKGSDEFLLLGTCGCYTWRHLNRLVKATNNFNGSHCYLIDRPMMEKLIGSYEYLLRKNMTIPVDGLISLLLRSQDRWALCPENDGGLFVQNRDIPSYILGDGKSLRNE